MHTRTGTNAKTTGLQELGSVLFSQRLQNHNPQVFWFAISVNENRSRYTGG